MLPASCDRGYKRQIRSTGRQGRQTALPRLDIHKQGGTSAAIALVGPVNTPCFGILEAVRRPFPRVPHHFWLRTKRIGEPPRILTPEENEENICSVLIPMKVVSDSDLNPVTGSEVKPIVFGAKRRWRSYGA